MTLEEKLKSFGYPYVIDGVFAIIDLGVMKYKVSTKQVMMPHFAGVLDAAKNQKAIIDNLPTDWKNDKNSLQ